MYILNSLDGKRAAQASFATKKAAKIERDRLSKDGKICVVSRSVDHRLGPSRPDPRCRNTERTSLKRKRQRKIEVELF